MKSHPKYNLTRTIGNTPLIQFDDNPSVKLKLEYHNPTFSMKDRVALHMINDIHDINEDIHIVEASSGNTGASVAFVCSYYGYDCTICVPESTSKLKTELIKKYGGNVVSCPNEGMDYQEYADHLGRKDGYLYLDQYHNKLNPEAHYLSTGPEIWEQTNHKIDCFVCPVGSGGTISGTGKYLKEMNPNIQIIGVDSKESNIHRFYEGCEPLENPNSGVEGLGKQEKLPTMWFNYIDQIVTVSDNQCFRQMKRWATDFGLFMGPSAAGTLFMSLQIQRNHNCECIVSLICDSGWKYI